MIDKVEANTKALDYVSLIFRQIERINAIDISNNNILFSNAVEDLITLVIPLADDQFKEAIAKIQPRHKWAYEINDIDDREVYAMARSKYREVIMMLDRIGILRERLGVANLE
jgi:hypothetical protein